MEFTVGDKVKVDLEKVKENIVDAPIEVVFMESDIKLISNENNVFDISHILNIEEERCPISISFNGILVADFRSDELILVEKAEG